MPAPVLVRRQVNQRLARTTLETPHDVVSWLGAVQAQDYPGARWALALRAKGLTDRRVEHAFDNGEILRTHVLRPTWHFVAPADIRWMLALTGPRVMSRMAPYNHQLELDRATFAKSRKVLERTLRDRHYSTRAELGTALERAGIVASGQRLAHLVMDAELHGIICSGPRCGSQFTYALVEERAAPVPSLTREEALAELVRRYFTSHGPATIRDFVWWSGLTTADARAGLALLGSDVCDELIEGVRCWSLPAHKPSSTRALAPAAHLLPNYDEYLIAYRDRGFSVASGGVTFDDFYAHFLTINGLLAGTWRRVVAKDAVTITVRTTKSLSRSDKALVERAAQRYARFMERKTILEYVVGSS
jgi:hypothetical protein